MNERFSLRLLTILSLVVYACLGVLLILVLARNLGFAVLFALTLILVVYGGWLELKNTHSRSSISRFAVLAAAAIVTEAVYFFSDPKNRRAVTAVLILSALYAGIAAYLRTRYAASARQTADAAGKAAHFNRPFLIINPRSGSGRAMKAHVDTLAEAQGIKVLITDPLNDVAALAEKAVEDGADVLGISGGDGSIGAAAKVAMRSNLPLVVLPGGTRCHFARDLGL